jgi:hypothetical protein
MRYIKYKNIGFLVLGLFFCVLGCKQPIGDAQFRIAQLLVSEKPMTIQLFKDGKTMYTQTLSFGALSSYTSVPAGTYFLRVSTGKKVLLDQEIGLGSKGKYSFCLYGLPVKGELTNSSTLGNTLHKIAEGEEASNPNGLLPKLKILNDIFYGDRSTAKIRWVHAAPGVQSLNGYSVTANAKDTISLKKLEYPEKSSFMDVKPGKTDVFWNLGSNKRKVARVNRDLQVGTLYTFFVFPQRGNYLDSLQVLTASAENLEKR